MSALHSLDDAHGGHDQRDPDHDPVPDLGPDRVLFHVTDLALAAIYTKHTKLYQQSKKEWSAGLNVLPSFVSSQGMHSCGCAEHTQCSSNDLYILPRRDSVNYCSCSGAVPAPTRISKLLHSDTHDSALGVLCGEVQVSNCHDLIDAMIPHVHL